MYKYNYRNVSQLFHLTTISHVHHTICSLWQMYLGKNLFVCLIHLWQSFEDISTLYPGGTHHCMVVIYIIEVVGALQISWTLFAQCQILFDNVSIKIIPWDKHHSFTNQNTIFSGKGWLKNRNAEWTTRCASKAVWVVLSNVRDRQFLWVVD